MLDWIARHPHWSAFAVFVIALTESLAVVGLIVPGAVLMVSAGALIGMGVTGFWPLLLQRRRLPFPLSGPPMRFRKAHTCCCGW